MNRLIVRVSCLAVVPILYSGCSTRHFTEMMLYECNATWDCEQPKTRDPALPTKTFQGNNPIYVYEGAKLSLELSQVNPGWIHQDRTVGAPAKGADTRTVTREQSEHINGKELWIVSRIIALTANSPLELEGKTYYKVSNLKFGSQSFRSIPLDLSEGRIFTHGADGGYRVRVRVYEVDGFELKRALMKTYRDNPGISGLLVAAWDTVVSTIGSLAGDAAVSVSKSVLRVESIEDPLVIESLLLQGGGTVELEATVHLYTNVNPRTRAQRDTGWIEDANYLLYDKWKSEQSENTKWDYSFGDRDEYVLAQKATEGAIKNAELTGAKSFVRLRVTQSEGPAESVSKDAVLVAHNSDQGKVDRITAHQSLVND